MDLLLMGAKGHMGQEVTALAMAEEDIRILPVDKVPPCLRLEEVGARHVDAVLDFSHHSATSSLLGFAQKRGIPAVIATTGHTEEEKAYMQKVSRDIPILPCENFSLGAWVFFSLARQVAEHFGQGEGEILEIHRKGKKDTPSGTALKLKEYLEMAGDGWDLPISSLRVGETVGVHSVCLGNDDESITLTHRVQKRGVFAKGSLLACRFLLGKAAGLYSLLDMVKRHDT